MLKAIRRIGRLEKSFGLSGRTPPVVYRINFVDSGGRVTGTMVMSDDPAQCVGYTKCEENRSE
jgi:hypothetical protein